MHRPAGAVTAQSRQSEALRDNALPGESSVAGDEQRHDHRAVLAGTAELILFGAHLAEHDRVDNFEVRRIGGEREVHLVAVELTVGGGTEVVFHIAGTFHLVGRRGAAFEFVKDGAMRLAHDLRQHVEPPTVRHTDHDLLQAEGAAALDDLFERRDHRFGTLQSEALGAGELEIAEFLESFRFDQLVEDRALAFAGEGDLLVGPLDALLHPALLRRIRDVHELDAERLAIGAPQDREDFA